MTSLLEISLDYSGCCLVSLSFYCRPSSNSARRMERQDVHVQSDVIALAWQLANICIISRSAEEQTFVIPHYKKADEGLLKQVASIPFAT